MSLNDFDKIKALRNGIMVSAIAVSSMAPSHSQAQEIATDHVLTEQNIPQDFDDDIFTLSPDDFRKPGENAKNYEMLRSDFKEIAHLTDFHDEFKNNPYAFAKPGKLKITPTLSFIPITDIEKNSQLEFQKGKAGLTQLSCKEYQSVCVAKNVKAVTNKLMSLHALGKTAEADAILPDFSKKYADKINVSSINVSMMGEDFQALKEDIVKNFSHIYPDFIRQTQDYWSQNHNFDKPEIILNDNQFIAVALTQEYDVTNPENCQLASQTRQYYSKIVDDPQQSQTKTKENEQTDSLSAYKKINSLRQGIPLSMSSKTADKNNVSAQANSKFGKTLQLSAQDFKDLGR